MKVFYLTNIPSPYRVKFWNQLGKQCELTVAFEASNESNRSWLVSQVGENFKPVYLPGITFGTQFHLNPAIKRHLKNYSYDIYVISGYASPTDMMAINTLVKQKRPFIFSADGGFAKDNEFPIMADIKKFFISAASWYMSSGKYCDKYLQHYGAKPEQIHRYNFSSISQSDFLNVPNISETRRKAILKHYGLNDKIVISPGQFIHRKGNDLLLDIWGNVNVEDSSLLIIGNGPEKKNYENIIRERNLKNVVIHDFVQKEKLMELYHISKILAFPTRYDIWGLTPCEAMSCRLPVISSPNAASTHELIGDDYNGYIEDLHNSVAWARHIEELLTNEDKRNLFGDRAYERVQEFTIESMVESYITLFKKIMRES